MREKDVHERMNEWMHGSLENGLQWSRKIYKLDGDGDDDDEDDNETIMWGN